MKKIIIAIFLLCANTHLLNAQTLYNNGATLYVNAPTATTATVKINGAIENNGTIVNAGRIDYTTTFANNGTLTGAGTLGVGTNWTNSATATVAPGTSGVGTMIILGNYTSGSSALTLELGGTTAGSLHDYLSVSGAANVTSGVLNVSFTSGYTPVGGESFVVLDAASLSGTFATLNLPTLTGSLTWQTDYDNAAGTLTLRITTVSLPVKLLRFEARKNADKVDLLWATATEINARNFDVERSNDGRIFEKIGSLAAKGSGSAYTFVDAQPASNINYYRLKINDFDGQYEYSNVIAVRFDTKTETKVFPNPTNGVINISAIETDLPTQVFDVKGVLLQDFSTTPNQIDLTELPSGFYLLKIGEQVTKIIKN